MTHLLGSTDSSVMRLAHPLRCAAENSQSLILMREFLGSDGWDRISKACESERLISEIIGDNSSDPAFNKLRQMLGLSSRMGGGTEVGNAYATLFFLRQAMHPQTYFVVDDALVEMLENTDISDDISAGMVNVPYSRFYVEFGKARTCNMRLPNTSTGQHILEGAYVERGFNSRLGEGLLILLTGSPLGKSGAMDDATHSVFLPLADPNLTVREALELTFKMGKEVSLANGLQVTPDSFLQQAFEDILFLIKVLLYIGLPEARKELHRDKTQWDRATSSLQSTAKKAKAAKRSRALVDHILISAPPREVDTSKAKGGDQRSVKSHWRRGHYRTQAHGPQHTLRRIIFIQPTLVHGDAGAAATPKYVVK